MANMDNKALVYNCKRYPPIATALPAQGPMGQVGISVMNIRPTVNPKDFCGEYHEKPVSLKLIT